MFANPCPKRGTGKLGISSSYNSGRPTRNLPQTPDTVYFNSLSQQLAV